MVVIEEPSLSKASCVLRSVIVASLPEVERTLRDLVRRLEDSSVDASSLPEERFLVVAIRDLDHTFTARLTQGKIYDLQSAEPSGDEDVKISVSSDDLIALTSGRMGVTTAMLTGKLRVDAGVRDLLAIRQLF